MLKDLLGETKALEQAVIMEERKAIEMMEKQIYKKQLDAAIARLGSNFNPNTLRQHV